MREEDKAEFAGVVKATLDLYGKEASAPVLRLWWAALDPYSIEEVRHGFTRFVRSPDSGNFPPKPADIIRMVEGTSGDRGMLAWAKVREAIQRVGSYQSVAFDDANIHAVIEDMGGWPKLCVGDDAEMHFRAADFAKRYRMYAERGGPDRFEPYLTGKHEAENRLRGHKTHPPVLIGNPEQCAQVMNAGSQAPKLQITRGTGMVSLADMMTPRLLGSRE